MLIIVSSYKKLIIKFVRLFKLIYVLLITVYFTHSSHIFIYIKSSYTSLFLYLLNRYLARIEKESESLSFSYKDDMLTLFN